MATLQNRIHMCVRTRIHMRIHTPQGRPLG
jgi:hypothetical protein